jgi:hypothetical protein
MDIAIVGTGSGDMSLEFGFGTLDGLTVSIAGVTVSGTTLATISGGNLTVDDDVIVTVATAGVILFSETTATITESALSDNESEGDGGKQPVEPLAPSPEESNEYRFDIDEWVIYNDGSFWFHRHVHGATVIWVDGGMASDLIVEGDYDAIPAIAASTERVMLFQQPLWDVATPLCTGERCAEDTLTLNRAQEITWRSPTRTNELLELVIVTAPGHVEHWRMIHASVTDELELELFPATADDCSSWDDGTGSGAANSDVLLVWVVDSAVDAATSTAMPNDADLADVKPATLDCAAPTDGARSITIDPQTDTSTGLPCPPLNMDCKQFDVSEPEYSAPTPPTHGRHRPEPLLTPSTGT